MSDPGPSRIDRAARVIPAPLAAVYAALTDPDAVARWMPPEGMNARIQAFEPWPGGAYRLELRYEQAGLPGKTGEGIDVVDGTFVVLEKNRSVVQAIRFVSDDPAFAGVMRMTWSLQSTMGGTELTITCEDVPAGISPRDHAMGLSSTLANLAAYIAHNR